MVTPSPRGTRFAPLLFLAVSFLGWIVFLPLTGCHPDANPRTRLRFWHGFTGKDGEVMLELVRRFNRENADIEITVQRLPWGTYYNKLFVAGRARSILEGWDLAAETLDSGRAAAKLSQLQNP